MRSYAILVIALALVAAGCDRAPSRPQRIPKVSPKVAARSPNNLRSREVYVRLYPRDGYLHIKQYHVESLLRGDLISEQVCDLRAKVSRLEYSESEFEFEAFDEMEESFFHDRGFLTGEFHLKTDRTNLKELITDSFAKVLRREVKLTVTASEITLEFEGEGVRLADNNAKAVYGSAHGGGRRLVFRNGQPMYEVVFTFLDDNAATPLVDAFGEDIHAEEDADT